jgi:fatty acid desaturase
MDSVTPRVDSIDRSALRDSRDRPFKELRRALTPRWGRVWLDIGAGYLVITATLLALAWLGRAVPAWDALWILGGAAVLGYTIAFVQLFLHEAVHFNLAPGRALNDGLANLFLGWMIGQDVRAYRKVHFEHHRHLGTTRDSEPSYFEALDARFIWQGLLGVKLLKVFTGRRELVADARAPAGDAADELGGRRRRLGMLAVGGALNLALVVVPVLPTFGGRWIVGVAWALGMAAVHPFVNALRNLLEHRGFEARRDVDYARVDHGPVTRMFGGGPLASTLGGAGFNRHLLHHWEPQLSYTRFAELEAYLLDTPAAPIFRDATTTYARAFVRLLRAP